MRLGVTEVMANAIATLSEGAFQQAGSALSDAQNVVREEAQKRSSAVIGNILNKLQYGKNISADEIELIKSWIVGDATGYTKMENDFQEWISEYDRLRDSLAKYESRECSAEELFELHGVLEDATRITYDITNFIEKKDRIEKFELAVGDGLDSGERDILVNALTSKLHSPEY